MKNKEAKEIIEFFDLEKHPEGGYFKEIYRSKGVILVKDLPDYFVGNRNYCTSIYFLLTSDSFSAFHKINQDEIWHFYKGSNIKLHIISPEGNYDVILIGNDFLKGEIPQFTVPANYYFAAEVVENNSYSFVGCTVAPGFDFRDFTLPTYQTLSQIFPHLKDTIKKLTHK